MKKKKTKKKKRGGGADTLRKTAASAADVASARRDLGPGASRICAAFVYPRRFNNLKGTSFCAERKPFVSSLVIAATLVIAVNSRASVGSNAVD